MFFLSKKIYLSGKNSVRLTATKACAQNVGVISKIIFTMPLFKTILNIKANPGVFQSLEPFIIASRIDASQLPPCAKGIVESFKTITNNRFAKVVQAFDNFPNRYTLTYTSQQALNNPANSAETDWEFDATGTAVDWSYLVKVNPTYLTTASKIAVARTLLHEMAHAFLLSYVEHADLDLTSVDSNDFPSLYQLVKSHRYGANPEPYQHEQMARSFVNPIRDALQQLDNNSKPVQYYEDLAWGVLTNTGYFDIQFPPGTPSRIRILQTNIAEDTMTPQAVPGYPTVSPQGLPCN
jgi:hypothetical protein